MTRSIICVTDYKRGLPQSEAALFFIMVPGLINGRRSGWGAF